ncbi:phytanoyl-CoA dioxygenase family protein [uncultured Tateyamaria sp.]|uniref:phytanoyl-CoA dioxygenase family protein n=1 Tax=uncultured Tateyamaria sp. TaxID=455651 RepID=UPI0026209151|nr:phytanoyl-CoA dioxygenase family protein [uncultured Tateyamaria sp.]
MADPKANALGHDFETTGFLWLRGVLSSADLDLLNDVMCEDDTPGGRITRAQTDLRAVLGPHGTLLSALAQLFGPVEATRAVAFSKTPDANWGVGWHRDQIIAVQDRADVPGFENWSRKSGVWHCKPPAQILSKVLFSRIFLSEATPASGGMEFCPGSHLTESKQPMAHVECEQAAPGDVLVLNMNILHRSRPAKVPSPRRVLRVDFAMERLPPPLAWARVA